MPAVSVVIPTLARDPARLRRALDALARQVEIAPEQIEVLVVLDATAGEASEVARPTRVLRAGAAGASAARNAGWRAAEAGIVLFIGDDIIAGEGLVAEHLRLHSRHPEDQFAVLGHVCWAEELRVTAFMRWLERGFQFDFGSIEGSEAGWRRFYTANVSVKRALLARVNGFDEQLPFLYEDLDLGRRLDAIGMRLRYAPAATAERLHPGSVQDWRARMGAVARAERRFCAKHPDIPPNFRVRLAEARRFAPGRGWGAAAARFVGPDVAWLGPRVWDRADIWFRQQLADAFEEGWEQAGREAADQAPREGAAPPPTVDAAVSSASVTRS